MPWKYDCKNNSIILILDPAFDGDLIEMARENHLWVLDTPGNTAAIARVWLLGSQECLCEVNRFRDIYSGDVEKTVTEMLYMIDDHYLPYPGIVVHGVQVTLNFTSFLEEQGFKITSVFENGCVASVDSAARLAWRNS